MPKEQREPAVVWEAGFHRYAQRKMLGMLTCMCLMKFLPWRPSGITLHAVFTHPASKQYRTMGTNMQIPPATPSGKPVSLRTLICSAGREGKSVTVSPSAGSLVTWNKLSVLTVPTLALLETGDVPLLSSQRAYEDRYLYW